MRLRRLSGLLPLLCPLAACASPACTVSETRLLGDWETVDARGAFEEFQLALEDGKLLFRSWLHQRPDIPDSPWTFDATTCRLRIEPTTDYPVLDFRLSIDDKGRLLMQEDDDKSPSIYRRYPD